MIIYESRTQWLSVLKFLNETDRNALSCVSKSFYFFFNSNQVFKQLHTNNKLKLSIESAQASYQSYKTSTVDKIIAEYSQEIRMVEKIPNIDILGNIEYQEIFTAIYNKYLKNYGSSGGYSGTLKIIDFMELVQKHHRKIRFDTKVLNVIIKGCRVKIDEILINMVLNHNWNVNWRQINKIFKSYIPNLHYEFWYNNPHVSIIYWYFFEDFNEKELAPTVQKIFFGMSLSKDRYFSNMIESLQQNYLNDYKKLKDLVLSSSNKELFPYFDENINK